MGSKNKKTPVDGGIRVRTYTLLSQCIDDGVAMGYQRAFKHTATPSPDAIREAIVAAIMLQIDTYFTFPELE